MGEDHGRRQRVERYPGPRPRADGPSTEWPYASLLVFGFFGSDTPAGRRLVWRSNAGIAVVVISVALLLRLSHLHWALAAGLLGLPAGVAGIAWSYARYLSELDELSRMIQLRAFAFSYGAAMTIAAALLGPALLFSGPSPLSAAAVLPWLVWAEGCRGLALVVLARRYR